MNPLIHKIRSLRRFVIGYKKYLDPDFSTRRFSNKEILGATMFFLSTKTTDKLSASWKRDSPEEAAEALRSRAAGTLDLPFPMVILETESGFFTVDLIRPEGTVPVVLYSIACQEIGPGNYKFDCFGRHDIDSSFNVRVENFMPVRDEELIGLMASVFNNRKASFGAEKEAGSVKVKGRSGTLFHNVKKIVHVVFDGDYSAAKSDDGTAIDWQHSWEVRGHWRLCPGLGKDRDGNYCIAGFTWVKDHQKGSGPLIKKTRLTEIKGDIHA